MDNLSIKSEYYDMKGKVIIYVCVISLAIMAFFALTGNAIMQQTVTVMDTASYMFYTGIFNWAVIFITAISTITIIIGVMYRTKAKAIYLGKDNSNKFFWKILN